MITSSEQWTCPGHGTPIDKVGRHYFFYHSYDRSSNVFTGREGLLIEYRFTPDGWIEFVKTDHPKNVVAPRKMRDDFSAPVLSKQWQWSVFQQPAVSIKGGELFLPATSNVSGTFLGQPTVSANYTTTIVIDTKASSAAAGVAAIGDENNLVYVAYQNGFIRAVQVKDGKELELAKKAIPESARLSLRMEVNGGKNIRFAYSNNGKEFSPLLMNVIDGRYLPPWDRAVRAGVVARGAEGTNGVFDSFEMSNQ